MFSGRSAGYANMRTVRTELHFHLLPDVDDGPRDHGEAVDLARLAVADGTGRVVVTPHVRVLDLDQLPTRVEELRARLVQASVPLVVCPGGELSPDDVASLRQEELNTLAHGPPDRRWLLLEAPLSPSRADFPAAAQELHDRGFALLIGHPERSASLSAAELRAQVRRGAVLQLNASSLTGVHGSEVQRSALELATSGLPFVVASDAHSPKRPPLMSKAADTLLAARLDPQTVSEAIDAGPARLLDAGLATNGVSSLPPPVPGV
jgi:protein-tyrosine phosphatase